MANKLIYLRVTDTCNLNCSHCFTSGSLGKKIEFDFDKTVEWISEWYNANHGHHRTVLIHGGEPFLVSIEKLKRLTDWFTDTDIEFGVVSNLTIPLTEAHYRWIQESCGGNIGTSWDYNIRFTTKKLEDRWLSNVRELMSNGFGVKVNISITKELINQPIDWFYDKLLEINASTFSLERLTNGGNAVRNPEIFVSNEIQDRWFLALYKEYLRRGRSVSIENFEILEEKVTTMQAKQSTSCRNCEQHFTTIRADGGISGCPNTAYETHANLADGYSRYLTSPKRLEVIVKEAVPENGCITCDVYDVCGGDCHKLDWDDRCAGYKHLLRHLTGRDNLIPTTTIEV